MHGDSPAGANDKKSSTLLNDSKRCTKLIFNVIKFTQTRIRIRPGNVPSFKQTPLKNLNFLALIQSSEACNLLKSWWIFSSKQSKLTQAVCEKYTDISLENLLRSNQSLGVPWARIQMFVNVSLSLLPHLLLFSPSIWGLLRYVPTQLINSYLSVAGSKPQRMFSSSLFATVTIRPL